MSVRIRLARAGSKKRPYYRIVVADSRSPRDGRFLEKIGTYNPLLDENKVTLVEERAKYWISVGASPSDRVSRFLESLGITEKKSAPLQTKKSQPKKKAQERIEASKAKDLADQEASAS